MVKKGEIMDNPTEPKQKSKGLFGKLFNKSENSQPDAGKDIELPEPPHSFSPKPPEQLAKELEIDKEISNIQSILDEKDNISSGHSHSAGEHTAKAPDEKPDIDLKEADALFADAEPEHAVKKPVPKPKVVPRPAVKKRPEPVKKKQVVKPSKSTKPSAGKAAKKRPATVKKKQVTKAKAAPKTESRQKRTIRRVLSADRKGKIILREKKKLEKEKREFMKKQRKQSELEKRLKKKEKELHQLDKKVKNSKKLLDREEASITSKVRQLEKSRTQLDTTQKSLKPRLSSIEQNENFLKKKINELNDREKLIIIKEEDIKKNESLLSQKEKDLVGQVKSIEDDKKIISDKESEISGVYKDIDNSKKLIAKKEDSISRKIDRMEQLEEKNSQASKELEKREKELDSRENKIEEKAKKASDLINESRKFKLQKDTIKKMQRTYTRLKEKLKDEYHQLEQVYNRRMVLEKGGTFTQEDLAELEKLKKSDQTKADAKYISKSNLQDFVDKTSSLISKGSYVEANKYLAMLISKYHDMDDADPFKKEAYYDILRLKHELKLALLK